MYRPSVREIVTLAALIAASLIIASPAEIAGHGANGIIFVLLLLMTALVEALPFEVPDRPPITLTLLPVALLWFYFGPFVTSTVAGAVVVVTRALQRRPAPGVSAAIVIAATWLGQFLASRTPHTFSLLGRLQIEHPRLVVFCAAFIVATWLLALLARDTNPRPEPLSGIAVGLLALILIGHDQTTLLLDLLLVGIVLLLVRDNVNGAAMRRRLAALAQHNEETERALTLERDANAAIVDFSSAGIFTLDRDLHVRHVNPALAALTGREAEQSIGRPADEVVGPQHMPEAVGEALRHALRTGRPLSLDSTLETPRGSRELVTSYSAVPDADGAVALGIGVVRDVTAEREEARAREDYFSLITHDLRNPLTAIVGNTQLLNQELERLSGNTALAHRFVARIEKANDQLMRLVDNLLELQRVESSHVLLRPQSIAMSPLVHELAAEFRGAALERGQEIRVSGPELCARADRTWCHEILANLLSNAVKYTPQGGVIELALQARGAHVAVSVTDSGHGLTPEEMAKLFTRFFRSKRPELLGARGTGLGLALAKRMATRMGGDIMVRSSVGAGSTFTLLLPLGDLPPFLEQRNNELVASG